MKNNKTNLCTRVSKALSSSSKLYVNHTLPSYRLAKKLAYLVNELQTMEDNEHIKVLFDHHNICCFVDGRKVTFILTDKNDAKFIIEIKNRKIPILGCGAFTCNYDSDWKFKPNESITNVLMETIMSLLYNFENEVDHEIIQ